MLTIKELNEFLIQNNADYELIRHDKPILSTNDAKSLFDINKAAPVFIMETEEGLIALIASAQRGRLDLKDIKLTLGFDKFKMANPQNIFDATGYKPGEIPLIGHSLSCIFDNKLLDHDYIYGGSGNIYYTLKINPNDVMRLNKIIKLL